MTRTQGGAAADSFPDGSLHHNFYLEESRPATPTRVTAAGTRCNKQTINAGDNPCHFQSPLPYMLAGLAAMVLLVVISLMILACSYLRGYFSDSNARPGGSSAPSTAPGGDPENPKAANLQALHSGFAASPEKIVVILAGQDKPTHLAQPIQVINKLQRDSDQDDVDDREGDDQRNGDNGKSSCCSCSSVDSSRRNDVGVRA